MSENPFMQYLKLEQLLWIHRRLFIRKRMIDGMIADPNVIDLASLQYELQVVTAKILGVEVAMFQLVSVDHLYEIEKVCLDNNIPT